MPQYIHNHTHWDSIYNHLYNHKLSNIYNIRYQIYVIISKHLILYNHTNIHHGSIFNLDYIHFQSIHIYTHIIHAELNVSFHLLLLLNYQLLEPYFLLYMEHKFEQYYYNSIATSAKLFNTNNRWIKKGFIWVYMKYCSSSLSWMIV